MTAFSLKLMAILSMLLDHIGYGFFPDQIIWRILGRFAMPIFCFFIAQGFRKTKNLKKYMGRIFIFAVLSEVIYDIYFFGHLIYLGSQNTLFTLLLGLISLWIYDWVKNKSSIAAILSVLICCALAQGLRCDYGALGVLLVFCFYFWEDNKKYAAPVAALLLLGYALYRPFMVYSVFSLIPIWFYNGKRGLSLKYLFYLFYPVHLILLQVIWEMTRVI